jgi:tetratricopeptide (TPR) repeat protein
MHRAEKMGVSDQQRLSYYNSAVADIDYFLERSDSKFVLLPEILTRKGEALTRTKKYAKAEQTFKEAFAHKTDYWPAYKGLADMYLAQGRKESARQALELGISKSIDKRMLKKMLDDLAQR